MAVYTSVCINSAPIIRVFIKFIDLRFLWIIWAENDGYSTNLHMLLSNNEASVPQKWSKKYFESSRVN